MLATRRTGSATQRAPLESYFREIDATSLLTAPREKELAARVQEGDTEARDEMVRANLRLVVNIARGYTHKGVDLSDLIAEGNLGLLRAVEAFDPEMNVRFSTYAAYWIKQSIRRAIINTSKSVRLPAYMHQLVTEWHRAVSQLEDKLGRPPSEEEVASRLGLSTKKLRIVKKALRVYSAGVQRGEESPALEEVLSDDGRAAPDMVSGRADELRQVLGLLNQLDPREACVLRLRYGLGTDQPLTLKEIGEKLGLTRERVRQIERQALATLATTIGGA
jgi:RNA polymerase primary sigma factor